MLTSTSPETTHTPQGDGNNVASDCRIALIETTHTPQGDGNLGFHFSYSFRFLKQPTPRKGTETNVFIRPFHCY